MKKTFLLSCLMLAAMPVMAASPGCVYGDGEDHSLIYAAYNMHWENHSFALPKINGTWKVDMSSNVSGAVIEDNNRSVCVEPRSVAILTGTYEIPAKKEK